ncbi:hypothetical protein CGLO_14301 [Colletotrichum gloeosporioides Cg-14]|uniref:Uncharacterized protein n=1 Tax=Colletotrichum gloeosporioides (strain Cg-14) TaxID=1237896 RepID=T0K4A0_COLGC|nr:hypothetical protein CGLO_14301 [Colletotrichum gloeosporioides Cg-14]
MRAVKTILCIFGYGSCVAAMKNGDRRDNGNDDTDDDDDDNDDDDNDDNDDDDDNKTDDNILDRRIWRDSALVYLIFVGIIIFAARLGLSGNV